MAEHHYGLCRHFEVWDLFGKSYVCGKFQTASGVAVEKRKKEMKKKATWWDLSPSQQESLEMIANKIARILNGDPNYAENWHDIAGYATLIDLQLQGDDK